MSDAKHGKIISGKSETAYERWEVPNVQSVEQQKQEQAGLLTARQLEELQKQAYDEGFQLGKDEGYQAAFQQGLEEGRQQGIQKGQEEVELVIKRFSQIMQFLAEPLNQVNNQVEEELISLSIATAKQIIRREINMDPGQIVAVIKEALAVLPSSSKKIKVFLHPADAKIARENLNISTETSSENSVNNGHSYHEELWSIIDEPNITRGGCQIKSEFSQIDASIETRIAEISARILGSERSSSERVDDTDSESETIDNLKPDLPMTSGEEKNNLSTEAGDHNLNLDVSSEPDNSPESDNSPEPDDSPEPDNSPELNNNSEADNHHV
ncbi:MAG: flagellar assembly protein FliH [gamma proteobacterium symbiont of Bathyaustriella thionipta]|nr:flagellar assembly protein FliH [gamma proteobacterium symbiont of Bathyaustriella thionipta]MCU7949524.1 flagellar assembly protein FliH [gamma proteobacterium symbiont of Bathyaustriella thionipta]MCU7954260.1 flagellar assembly protein FliH [gamma proteobacterium symbiont of Bathyaustriella thionipta]MCU7956124.1 flagellar assembly protein FliH [gamma proteobacterium symbiont of Bathyaustriella thionipta]MCU7968725.1 flagellar assembly protein FliH [gamma proteobacterium symbiont of Bathy